MADIRITGPDGSRFSFPEGTPRTTIEQAMRQHYGGRDENRRGTTPYLNRALADIAGAPGDIVAGATGENRAQPTASTVARAVGAPGDVAQWLTNAPEDAPRDARTPVQNLIGDNRFARGADAVLDAPRRAVGAVAGMIGSDQVEQGIDAMPGARGAIDSAVQSPALNPGAIFDMTRAQPFQATIGDTPEARTADAVIDAPRRAIQAAGQYLGSENLGQSMEGLGIRVADPDARPETMGEYIGRGLGDAAGALLPGAAAVRGMRGAAVPVSRAVQSGTAGSRGTNMITTQPQTFGQGMADDIARPFISQPRRALAAETGAGVGLGVGGYGADQLSEGDERYRPLGETTGALLGGAGPSAALRAASQIPVANVAISSVPKFFPWTEAGGTGRARDRLQSLMRDPEAARQSLDDPFYFDAPDVPLAARTGEPRLMALDNVARDTAPQFEQMMIDQERVAMNALEDLARAPAMGRDISDAQGFVSDRLRNTLRKIDDRVAVAQRRAQEKIDRLEPDQKPSQSAQIVRDEIEGALRTARNEEKQLWGSIPKSTIVPTSNARARYAQFMEDTPGPQREDIPQKARQFLDRDQSNEAFADQEQIGEMLGLYSKLRETARQARAAQEWNKARISDDIADSIMLDLEGASGTPFAMDRVQEAIDFSRQLNTRFSQGSVGRLLGRERDGGTAVAPERTLDVTAGRPGLAGAVSVDELRRAGANAPNAERAMEAFMQSRFRDHTIRDGKFSPQRAQDFLRKNDELLDRFPMLKTMMQDAEGAEALARNAQTRMAPRAKALRDPRRSAAAMLADAPPHREIETVFSARDPGAAARELRRQAAKDDSGRALAGLKGGVFDHLTRSARKIDESSGAEYLSGVGIMEQLRDPRISEAVSGILTTTERRRLERIARELMKMEQQRSRKLPSVGKRVIDDAPGKIISLLGTTIAARQGARLGQGTSGASLLTASFASQRMRRILESITNDRAEQLIRQALVDEDLFRVLMSDGKIGRAGENRIIEALAPLAASGLTEIDAVTEN